GGLLERHGAAAHRLVPLGEALGQPFGAFGGAVGDEDQAGALPGDGVGRQRAHGPRAQHHDPAAGEGLRGGQRGGDLLDGVAPDGAGGGGGSVPGVGRGGQV